MSTINVNLEICRLIQYGLQESLLHEADKYDAVNRILEVLGLSDFCEEAPPAERLSSPQPILDNLLDWATERGLIEGGSIALRDLLDTKLMACMMPRPSEVVSQFQSLYQVDKKAATDYYYKLSRASNYIRTDRVAKDESWVSPSRYGDLVITINLSKPEKDPKAIAAARNAVSTSYPPCALCRENEGFAGSMTQAARGNHRLIPMHLADENWFLQYSPYVYYNEHCIFLNEKHIPMKVNRSSFVKLLQIIDIFPHYFVGSNADLPIVGGSILSHDHFQGGCYEFPMAKAPVWQQVSIKGFEALSVGLVDWPMSVIRIKGTDKESMITLADEILTKWRGYSDEAADILAFTGGTPHNTITPIARFRDGNYELDLVLRNNRTTDEHPLGLFHPHAEYHHIKKENIGLIEVMGLAILPARLKGELKLLTECLCHPERENEVFSLDNMKQHEPWYRMVKEKLATGADPKTLVQNEVGSVFCQILENAGVYKTDDDGKKAFLRFIGVLNQAV